MVWQSFLSQFNGISILQSEQSWPSTVYRCFGGNRLKELIRGKLRRFSLDQSSWGSQTAIKNIPVWERLSTGGGTYDWEDHKCLRKSQWCYRQSINQPEVSLTQREGKGAMWESPCVHTNTLTRAHTLQWKRALCIEPVFLLVQMFKSFPWVPLRFGTLTIAGWILGWSHYMSYKKIWAKNKAKWCFSLKHCY